MTIYANGMNFGEAGIKVSSTKIEDVMKESGLDYHVNLKDCFLADGTKVPKLKATVRDDNNKIMGTVGERYTCLQNIEAFQWFDEFVEAGTATIEHAGQLKNNIIFVQAKINIDPIEIIKNDVIQSYVTLLNSFDGSTSVFAGFFPNRLFCANQLPKLRSSNMLKIKHTQNLHVGMEKIAKIMDVHKQEFIATSEQYKFLASKGVNAKDLEKYVKLIFAKNKEDECERILPKIQELYECGRGASKTTRNYYGAFNAVNEYLNWETGRSVDNRLKSLWVGINASLNQKALNIASELAQG